MGTLLLGFCNWSTLGVCAALKLPQISAVLAARSARGISLPSLLLELAGFLVFLRYQYYYEYPLLTYLEYPILIAQGNHPLGARVPQAPLLPLTQSLSLADIVLLLCVFHFNGNVKGAAPYIVLYPSGIWEWGFAASWFLLTLQKWIIDLAMNFCTVISAASKFAQLQCLWKTQDSGAVSALTWILASYTCSSKSWTQMGGLGSPQSTLIRSRIITTLMTTNDLTILIRFVIMLALNMWVTATVLRYRKA
ncbi:PQ-loop repeat-containing protein 3, partial [Galemys pyrenaicus]